MERTASAEGCRMGYRLGGLNCVSKNVEELPGQKSVEETMAEHQQRLEEDPDLREMDDN